MPDLTAQQTQEAADQLAAIQGIQPQPNVINLGTQNVSDTGVNGVPTNTINLDTQNVSDTGVNGIPSNSINMPVQNVDANGGVNGSFAMPEQTIAGQAPINLSPQEIKSDLPTSPSTGLPIPQNGMSANEFDRSLIKNNQEQQKTQTNIGNIQSEDNKKIAEFLDQSGKEQNDYLQEKATRVQQAADDSNTRINAIQQNAKRVAAMTTDPGRFWNSRSSLGKAEVFTSMALGGFGEGFSNGAVKNRGLEIFHDAVDKDIESQKGAIDNQWKQVATDLGIDNTKFARDQYVQQQHDEIRLGQIEKYKTYIAAQGARSTSDLVKENAKTAVLTLDQSALKTSRDIQARAEALQAAIQARADAERKAEEGKNDKNEEEFNKAVQERMKTPGITADQAIADVAAQPGFDRSIKRYQRKAIQTELTNVQQEAKDQGITITPEQAVGVALKRAKEGPKSSLFNGTSGYSTPLSPEKEKAQDEKKQIGMDVDELDKRFVPRIKELSPSLLQGAPSSEQSRNRTQFQDEYNSFVYKQVAKAYKIDTTAMEPKNLDLIKKYAQPYLIDNTGTSWEPENTTKLKVDGLRHLMRQSTAGLTGDDPNSGTIAPSMPTNGAPANVASDPFAAYGGTKGLK